MANIITLVYDIKLLSDFKLMVEDTQEKREVDVPYEGKMVRLTLEKVFQTFSEDDFRFLAYGYLKEGDVFIEQYFMVTFMWTFSFLD
uniref:Uncharacterized protein n=1 Tax=viral metagenome TaxID=1070528 RepID=A0A6C0EZX0_9ZZZZ